MKQEIFEIKAQLSRIEAMLNELLALQAAFKNKENKARESPKPPNMSLDDTAKALNTWRKENEAQEDGKENILRIRDVVKRVGMSKATIYRLVDAGKFPKQINIGVKATGWIESEVDEWLLSLIEGRQ
ncbi:helix-turn-helix transcriptional regulator [Desulfosediminicola flagellatus]|uniref:helix-turn-helix transcriptional regulator n=1 Tax=Desulfosediminicola flagellatus TaxID=2569541 RepID=UPI001E3B0050|nr:AlpA family transcriptional regulator [Desulfosediminicola flagellatus]